MLNTAGCVRVAIGSARDLVTARQKGRAMALDLGFSTTQSTLIAAAISELARNIIRYAGQGEVLLRPDGDSGIAISARDDGPGIADIDAALRPGYSTSGGLGLGLPGVKRIADAFEIISSPAGTTINLIKRRR